MFWIKRDIQTPLVDRLKAEVDACLSLAARHERHGRKEQAERLLAKAMKADAKLQRS